MPEPRSYLGSSSFTPQLDSQPTHRANGDLRSETMTMASCPIAAIVNPSGQHTAEAGDFVELSVTIHNRGPHDALIDVYLSDVSQTVLQWCSHPFQRLALISGQSSEVLFQLQIPLQTLPELYPYQIVIDAPDHYPEDTPIQYDQRIQVIPKYHTTIEVNDPTFTVQPITRSHQPLLLQPGGSVEATLSVYNRSDRVDRFRLTCPDLDPHWYSVRYPEGFETVGLITETDSLELNPRSQGEIRLTITLPTDAVAGQHTPTLRLHSANNPNLALLDILYLEVSAHHLLTTELKTLVSTVKYQAGLYWIRLHNCGNTPRQLRLRARILDENPDACRFHWAEVNQAAEAARIQASAVLPPEMAVSPIIQVLPNQSVTMSLGIQPYPARSRPFWGAGHIFNFIVELDDEQTLPLPQDTLHGSMIWQPRPWWHLILLLLLGVGVLTLVGFPLWLLLRPPSPAELLEFSADEVSYQEMVGMPIRLNWQISQPKQIQTIQLAGRSPEDDTLVSPSVTFDFSDGIPSQLEPFCTTGRQLICQNVPTDAYRAGTYRFDLEVETQRGRRYRQRTQTLNGQTDSITILPIPLPNIRTFEPTQARYIEAIAPDTSTEIQIPTTLHPPIRLNWAIAHPGSLQRLVLISRDADQSQIMAPIEFDFSQGVPRELEDFCQLNGELSCWNVPTPAREMGHYTFELQLFITADGSDATATQITDPIKIERPDLPFTITSFTVNNEASQPKYVIPLNVDDVFPVIPIEWVVDGDPDVTVELLPAPGTVPRQGAIAYPLSPQGGIETLTLRVTNQSGESISRSVTLETVPPPPEQIDNTSSSSNPDGRSPTPTQGTSTNAPPDSIHTPRPTESDRLSPAEIPPQFIE